MTLTERLAALGIEVPEMELALKKFHYPVIDAALAALVGVIEQRQAALQLKHAALMQAEAEVERLKWMLEYAAAHPDWTWDTADPLTWLARRYDEAQRESISAMEDLGPDYGGAP